jgi:hypothetical protein
MRHINSRQQPAAATSDLPLLCHKEAACPAPSFLARAERASRFDACIAFNPSKNYDLCLSMGQEGDSSSH